MDFTNMNMNTGFFSWIISADISVLLKIYGYEYEYAKFSWILFMGSPRGVLILKWNFDKYMEMDPSPKH